MSAPQPQNFLSLAPVHTARYLSLAPATSPSYPQKPAVRSHARAAAIPESRPAPVARQSSSGYRILKLGPVHYGEHADEHKADFHEVVLN